MITKKQIDLFILGIDPHKIKKETLKELSIRLRNEAQQQKEDEQKTKPKTL